MKQINKSSFVVWSIILSLVFLTSSALASSTIGTNISTTGTFTQSVGSATAARFQNAAGTTNVLWVDTTNTTVGVNAGGATDTTFEVGGTASVSGIITLAGGQVRPQSNSATAFRFQNAAGTTNVLAIDTTNTRAGVNAGGTIDTTFEIGGTASVSGVITVADGQVRPQSNGTTAFRFQNAAGTTTVFTVDTTNTRIGVGSVGVIDTTFEVGGTASVSSINLGGTTTLSTNLSSLINKHYSATFSLNFSTLTTKCSDSAGQTLTGAGLGDTLIPAVNIALPASFSLQAFVSTTDTVVFRWCQFGTPLTDPDGTGAIYKADLWGHAFNIE